VLTLGREAVAWALAQAQQSQEKYHSLECRRCRHVIKVQVAELRRLLPKGYPLPQFTPSSQPVAEATSPTAAGQAALPQSNAGSDVS